MSEGILLHDDTSAPSVMITAEMERMIKRVKVFIVQSHLNSVRQSANLTRNYGDQTEKIERNRKINDKKGIFPFLKRRKDIKHGAIAVTAIAPLLNLNLNYEKLRVKYTNSFDTNNYLTCFFINQLIKTFHLCLDSNSFSRSAIPIPICSLSTSRW